MQAKFYIAKVYNDGRVFRHGTKYEFSSLDSCFDFLAAKGHRIKSAELIDRATISGARIEGVKPKRDLSVIYEDTTDFSTQAKMIIGPNVSLYHIEQTQGNNVPFGEFVRIHNSWSNSQTTATTARKIFHPGNSLTLAFILIGAGLILGAACPPALIFAALGVAAFSAVSALVYGVCWLSRDYNVYKAKVAANSPEVIDRVRKDAYSLYAYEVKSKSYFSYFINRLGNFSYFINRLGKWAGEHKRQAVVMRIGLALFVTSLGITALAFTGGLAAVPILGALGAMFGGALGSSALASILAGATLILAPVNILDTIRRFVIGVYEKKDSLKTVPPQEVVIPQQVVTRPQVVIPPPPPPRGPVRNVLKLETEEEKMRKKQELEELEKDQLRLADEKKLEKTVGLLMFKIDQPYPRKSNQRSSTNLNNGGRLRSKSLTY